MKKKILTRILALAYAICLIFGLVGCSDGGLGGNGENGAGSSSNGEDHVHNYDIIIVQPTCVEQGYTLYKCSCGENYKDNYEEWLKKVENGFPLW